MSSADAPLAALKTGYAQLADLVGDEGDLSEAQLTTPTVLGEWTVAQVLSHLGSGAVISRKTIGAGLAGKPTPAQADYEAIWAEWDAMSPAAQRSESLKANQAFIDGVDKIPESTRETVRIDLGFLPEPVDLAFALTFRLAEFALHSWDVRAFLDDEAVVEASAVPLLLPMMPMFLSFAAKPEKLGRPATFRVELTDPAQRFGLEVGPEGVKITDVPQSETGTLVLPAEAWLRLVTGRLRRDHTPEKKVTFDGPVTLDELRRVFPGF